MVLRQTNPIHPFSLRNVPAKFAPIFMSNLINRTESFLARDIQSNLGKNLNMIKNMTGLDLWMFSVDRMKEEIKKAVIVPVPQQEHWRIPFLTSLMERRSMAYYENNTELLDYTQKLIDSLVIK